MITIIDYGLGNIQAFVNVYKRLHIPVVVAKTEDDLALATKLILPGVGAFDHAMERFTSSGMKEKATELVKTGVPVLGICVGMQMLADGSDEGVLPGLSWIPGRVRAFNTIPNLENLPLPHMGWNDVKPRSDFALFKEIQNEPRFYFLHSYFFEASNTQDIAATSQYGLGFSCVVAKNNVFGVQFHPEKSHHFGVTLLKNFAEL